VPRWRAPREATSRVQVGVGDGEQLHDICASGRQVARGAPAERWGTEARRSGHDDGRVFRRRVGEHKAELVATETIDAVHAPEGPSQVVDQGYELLVSGRVTSGVVDSFEAVEVDGNDAQVELGTSTPGQLAVEIALEGPPIGAPRQRIAESGPLELVGGAATGVDHREVDEASNRSLPRLDRDQTPELHELLDCENRRSDARPPPRRGSDEVAPTLDRHRPAGLVRRAGAGRGGGLRRLARVLSRARCPEEPGAAADDCSKRVEQQLALVGIRTPGSTTVGPAPFPPCLGQRLDRGGAERRVARLVG